MAPRLSRILFPLAILVILLWVFIPDGRHSLRRRKADGTLETVAEMRERERRMDLLRKSAIKSTDYGADTGSLDRITIDQDSLRNQIRNAVENANRMVGPKTNSLDGGLAENSSDKVQKRANGNARKLMGGASNIYNGSRAPHYGLQSFQWAPT